jgi:Skp family chaperone for outer membrane proteins
MMKNLILIMIGLIVASLNTFAFGLLIGAFATMGTIGFLLTGYLYFQSEKIKIVAELDQETQPFFQNEDEWRTYYHRDATPLSEESQLKVSLAKNINQLAVG